MQASVVVVCFSWMSLAAGIVNNGSVNFNYLNEGTYCDLSEGGIGVCQKKSTCDSRTPFETGLCSEFLICCPPSGEKSRQKCREFSKIETCSDCESVHPNRAVRKEFPHLALIGFGSVLKNFWRCLGSLISERYVLSSAACLDDTKETPQRVKLGDLDFKHDGFGTFYVSISVVITHPGFASGGTYNDIALYRLARDVYFNEFVRPACLHTERALPVSKAIMVGWGGYTNGNDDADRADTKAKIPIIADETCKKKFEGYSVLPKGYDTASMLCAGQRGRSTCGGDTGVPLQMKMEGQVCMYSLIATSSFGNSDCTDGNDPGGFMRISYYVPWIESVVWA